MAFNYTAIRVCVNFIIVLLPIIGLFQNFNGEKLLYASTLTDTINLENIYCKNPQSYHQTDLHCSSTRQFFLTLRDDCIRQNVKSNRRVDKSSRNAAVTVLTEPSATDNSGTERREKENRSASAVDLVVIGLLVISAVLSLAELYKEILRRRNQVLLNFQAGANGGAAGEVKPGDRRMSLVDLTVSRHARKRESQQLEMMRVNNNPTGVRPPPPLIRRMSFPAQLPEMQTIRGRHPAPMRQLSWCPANHTTNRRLSTDISEDDSSPDRRRVRIIRRH